MALSEGLELFVDINDINNVFKEKLEVGEFIKVFINDKELFMTRRAHDIHFKIIDNIFTFNNYCKC